MNKSQLIASLDPFTDAYLIAALWTSTDDDYRPLNASYTVADLALETLQQALADCKAFQTEHYELIKADLRQAGHDFWLTRNQRDGGFWAGAWPEEDGKKLTEAADRYGTIDFYVGADGQIHS